MGLNSKIRSSSMNIFFLATIFGLNFFILFIGVRDDTNKSIFPFLFRLFFACLRNLNDTSSPLFPPVVATWESLGSLLSLGR